MTDDTQTPNGVQTPELANLVKAAEPTGKQKFINFFGLGYGGNTAVSVSSVKLVRKFLPGFVERWEARHEEKYFQRKVEEQITPVADELTADARQVIEDKLRADAKVYGKKTVDSRLLATGGFAMLPFQSARQITDYGKNIEPHIQTFRDECTKLGIEDVDGALQEALDKQRSALRDGDKKGNNILNGALEKPKFNPLGPEAKSDLPKWIVGRVIALGAAFSTQTIVDDRFTKPKDAVDNTIAKIVTRIAHPTGYKAPSEAAADGGLSDPSIEKPKNDDVPAGVDPKILDVVRMVTTDAYMTTVAIGAHMASMNYWDKRAPDVKDKIGELRQRFASGGVERGV